jgi:hypothetical protein
MRDGKPELKGYKTPKIPHFLGNRLKDGGEVVCFMRQPRFTPQEIPGTNFC